MHQILSKIQNTVSNAPSVRERTLRNLPFLLSRNSQNEYTVTSHIREVPAAKQIFFLLVLFC